MKKKIFTFMLALILALPCMFLLTACKDKRPTVTIASLPQNVESAYLYKADIFGGGSSYHNGDHLDNGTYKVMVELKSGYSLGSLKVLANGNELQLVSVDSTNASETRYYCEYKVGGNVSITFSGAVEQIKRNVLFKLNNDSGIDNVKIEFANPSELNLNKAVFEISEFFGAGATRGFSELPVNKLINFSIYAGDEENSYNQGLLVECYAYNIADPEDTGYSVSNTNNPSEYNEQTNNLKYNFSFDNYNAKDVRIEIKLSKADGVKLSIGDTEFVDSTLVSLSASNNLFAISGAVVDQNDAKILLSDFNSNGKADVVLTFNGLTDEQQFASMLAQGQIKCNVYGDSVFGVVDTSVTNKTITFTVPRPVTFDAHNPYNLTIQTNFIKLLTEATGESVVKVVGENECMGGIAQIEELKVNGVVLEQSDNYDAGAQTYKQVNQDFVYSSVGYYSAIDGYAAYRIIMSDTKQQCVVMLNIDEQKADEELDDYSILITLADDSTINISAENVYKKCNNNVNEETSGTDYFADYSFMLDVGAQIKTIEFTTSSDVQNQIGYANGLN